MHSPSQGPGAQHQLPVLSPGQDAQCHPPQDRQLSDSQRLANLSGRAPCSVFERLLRLSPGLCKYAQPRSAHGQMSVHSKIGRWFWRPAIRICRTHTRLRSGCSRLGRRSKRMWMSSTGTRRFRSGQTGGVYKCDGNSAWIGPRSPEPDTGRNRTGVLLRSRCCGGIPARTVRTRFRGKNTGVPAGMARKRKAGAGRAVRSRSTMLAGD